MLYMFVIKPNNTMSHYVILLFILFYFNWIKYIQSKTIIMVILGSSNADILSDRIQAAISYSSNLPKDTTPIWFLTGGIKFSNENIENEAVQMQKQLKINKDEMVVLDKNATNSAENFANLLNWIQHTFPEQPFPKIVVTTSEFHKTRASTILEGILRNRNARLDIEWNLGKVDCPYCWTDEHIYMKNVHMDIMRAVIMFDM